MSTSLSHGDKCPCGQPLPWHLFTLGIGLKHICNCERTYAENEDGEYVMLDVTTPNPIARAERDGSLQRSIDELMKLGRE